MVEAQFQDAKFMEFMMKADAGLAGTKKIPIYPNEFPTFEFDPEHTKITAGDDWCAKHGIGVGDAILAIDSVLLSRSLATVPASECLCSSPPPVLLVQINKKSAAPLTNSERPANSEIQRTATKTNEPRTSFAR